MKLSKIISILLALTFLLSFTACAAKGPRDTEHRVRINLLMNGKTAGVIDENSFKKGAETKTIGDTSYYGVSLETALAANDLVNAGDVNAVFTKSSDGYAAYFPGVSGLFVATHKVENGEYISLADGKDGAASYTLVGENGKAKAVSDIYFLSDAQDWKVPVNVNGEEKTVTIDDFMSMKPQYVTLGHKYNGGADYYEGEFLAVDSKTFWETLGCDLTEGKNDETGEDGNPVPVYFVPDMDLKITGYVQASGSAMKLKVNTDLKADPSKEKTAWLVYYFVLVEGNDHHEVEGLEPMDLDLSCIFSGTGIRWMTTPITQIDMVPHVEEED